MLNGTPAPNAAELDRSPGEEGNGGMGANYNTILAPAMRHDQLLVGIGRFLNANGAAVEVVEEQERRGAPFASHSASTVLFGPATPSGWVPLTSWGDALIPYPLWYTANPLAAELSRTVAPVLYLFSFDSGCVAGYSVFEGGEQVEAQTLPWRDGVEEPDFTPTLPAPTVPTLLGKALRDPSFDYTRFARGTGNLEAATAALVARFGLDAHLMDPLHMDEGHGLAVIHGDYVEVDLAGWSCVSYRRQASGRTSSSSRRQPRSS
jgi:hypothetical protein